jgi:chorismate mutase
MIKLRGVRGATTVEENTHEAILSATRELLDAMIQENDIDEEDVASVLFSTTPDLNMCFPAKAARDLGWHRTALMGFQEIDHPEGIPRCIRVLIHWNTPKSLDEIKHVYMERAMVLRPDLFPYPDNKVILQSKEEAR